MRPTGSKALQLAALYARVELGQILTRPWTRLVGWLLLITITMAWLIVILLVSDHGPLPVLVGGVAATGVVLLLWWWAAALSTWIQARRAAAVWVTQSPRGRAGAYLTETASTDELFCVCAHPTAHGLGTELMRHILSDRAHSPRPMALVASSTAAVGFYRRFGFHTEGRRFLGVRMVRTVDTTTHVN